MTDLFISVLNMSITASYVILAVLLLRLALKGLPKKYSYALWSVVGFRLVCPVSFKSVFSLFSLKPFDMTKAQQMNEYSLTYVKTEKPILRDELTTGISAVNSVIENQVVPSDTFQSSYTVILHALEFLWAAGIAALLIYSAVSFIRLRKRLSTSILLEKGVYQSENISSPFIVGIIRPRIYVPSGIDEGYMQYVLSHERYHIKRFDNGIKLLAYLLLVLHWFNPLVWLAFYLMAKDMEMSCDEAVLSKNDGIKKAYSSALLSFATNKRFPAPSPISFSENGVKARIKNVLHYRKPKKILQAVAIILCLSLLTACAANPKQTLTENKIKEAAENIIGESDAYTAGKVIGVQPAISYQREDGSYYDKITIKNNSLVIADPLGNEIFKSKSASEAPLETKEEYGLINVELDNNMPLMIEEDYGDLFRRDNLTSVTYTGEKAYEGFTDTYKVYYDNGEPFALCDTYWVYLLEERKADKEFVKETSEIVKMYYKDGPLFNEGNKIPLAKAKELINNGAETDIDDFMDYEHCAIGSGVINFYLDIADFNGYVEATAPGEEGSGFDIELYYNDGSLLMSYSRPTYLGPPEWLGQDIQEDLASLKDIGLSDKADIVEKNEVNTYGIDGGMQEADIVKLLGQPKEIRDEGDETLGMKAYVYDGVKISFIKTINGEEVSDMDDIYSAVFTDKNAEFVRGIKFGDSLYDVLEKLPREYDYRTGNIYGDPYNKYSKGHAVIGYENNNKLTIKISCGYWPLIVFTFNSDLALDSATILYNTDGIG